MSRRSSALTIISTPHGQVRVRSQYARKQSGWVLVVDGPPLALELLEPRSRMCGAASHRRTITPPGGAVAATAIRGVLREYQERWSLILQAKKRPTASKFGGPVQSLGELVTLYLRHCATGLRVSSRSEYSLRFRSLYTVILPSTPLAMINRERVQQVIADLSASGRAALTVRNLVGTLVAALAYGGEAGHLDPVSTKGLVLPPLVEQHRNVLGDGEVVRLLASAEKYSTDAYLLVALAVLAGLRASEVLSVQWPDVDLIAKTLTVRNRSTFTTKNGRSRIVPVSERLLTILAAHQRDDGYVVRPNALPRTGRPRWSFRKSFTAVLAAADIDHLPFHGLRRSFATRAIENGVPISKVRIWLGHHSLLVTQKYIQHGQGYDIDIDRATA